jgi:hypothetical protein
MQKQTITSLHLPGMTHPPRELSLRRRVARRLFGIAPGETSFQRRGFRWDSEAVRERLEGVAGRFVEGYHAALEESGTAGLAARLAGIPAELSGFAHEGAGMALALLDTLTLWRRGRLDAFLRGPADPHSYLVYVGAGWILARLPLSPERLLARLDPIQGWLALDGYGFHEGFFHAPRSVARREVPAKVRGYARRAFDQGLGRSLWFVEGAGPARLGSTISAFPPARQGDLWSGTGLACAYAGGAGAIDRAAIEELLRRAGEHAPQLAQGIGFAAEARQRAGNPAPHTELACQVVWGRGAAPVAELVLQASAELPPDGAEPAFEVWRRRIQERFTERGTTS